MVDLLERLADFDRYGLTATARFELRMEAWLEIKQLRAERDDWRGVAECNDAFLQAAKEGHPITIIGPAVSNGEL